MEDKENELLNLIPLDSKTKEIAQKIIDEDSLDKVKDLTHLFNLNQAKKNVLRILKLNTLLDKVSDTMIERFEQTPGQFSNADLLNYMQVTQSAIDRANKSLNMVDESQAITLNQVNQVNLNVGDEVMDKDSREKILEAVKHIMDVSKNLELDLDKEDNIVIEEDKEELKNNILKEEE